MDRETEGEFNKAAGLVATPLLGRVPPVRVLILTEKPKSDPKPNRWWDKVIRETKECPTCGSRNGRFCLHNRTRKVLAQVENPYHCGKLRFPKAGTEEAPSHV